MSPGKRFIGLPKGRSRYVLHNGPHFAFGEFLARGRNEIVEAPRLQVIGDLLVPMIEPEFPRTTSRRP